MDRKNPIAIVAASCIGVVLLASCMSVPTIPAKGKLHDQPVASTVDAEIARYYLENYLQGIRDDPRADKNIDALHARHADGIPSREALKDISQGFSVDFAALFLADRLLSNECNKRLNQSFARQLDSAGEPLTSSDSFVVLFVPGWDYVNHGHVTGADFAKPRELATRFKLENHLAKLSPTGSVQENADVIAKEIAQLGRSGKKILIAGASSAGPAIHLALGERIGKAELDSIKAWLNLGGILQGSPLVDFFQVRPQRWLFDFVAWYNEWSKTAILSMSTELGRARFARLQIDPGILVINYLGIPLSGQLSKHSKGTYALLRSDGPNDGLTLLSDAIAPNSLTIVALGSDHFFAEDPRIDDKTIALMKLITIYVDKGLAQGCR
jgi:hypothetical protein